MSDEQPDFGTFICASCDRVIRRAGSVEDAKAEAARLFPEFDPNDSDDMGEVCDDCWKEMIPWMQANGIL